MKILKVPKLLNSLDSYSNHIYWKPVKCIEWTHFETFAIKNWFLFRWFIFAGLCQLFVISDKIIYRHFSMIEACVLLMCRKQLSCYFCLWDKMSLFMLHIIQLCLFISSSWFKREVIYNRLTLPLLLISIFSKSFWANGVLLRCIFF